jgi:hypothetical protein
MKAEEQELYPCIPKGFKQTGLNRYESDTEIIIIGQPNEDDDSHNCDQMGCGWDHVMQRIKKR